MQYRKSIRAFRKAGILLVCVSVCVCSVKVKFRFPCSTFDGELRRIIFSRFACYTHFHYSQHCIVQCRIQVHTYVDGFSFYVQCSGHVHCALFICISFDNCYATRVSVMYYGKWAFDESDSQIRAQLQIIIEEGKFAD